MKKFLKKVKKLEHGHLRELALLCAAVVLLLLVAGFISSGGINRTAKLMALSGINHSSITANLVCDLFGSCAGPFQYVDTFLPGAQTIVSGQSATLTWTIYGANHGSFCVTNSPPFVCTITTFVRTANCVVNKKSGAYVSGTCGGLTGITGTYTVTPPVGTNTYYLCSDYIYPYIGCNSATVTVTAPPATCPVSSFSSPWNTSSYLIYSGGQGSISNWYGRYCVHNYSGNAIFIPMSTPGEWNDFAAAAPAQSIGISAY